ncbi:YjbH domain-containing protein [Aquifex aeolicus]|uniref:YjbH domain-containing protein n=1 Tax=Aquifex aeolicus TaxID=63363 RepID=UPI0002E5B3E2|nr:YjbH domain-containing protein [Aquifex aeolicus]
MGIGGDYVWKRKPDVFLGVRKDWDFYDFYVSAYYMTQKPQLLFSVKAGRFLVGDKGVRIEVSRIVKGFEVGFWYTYSDTSDFTGPNKNYHDKGVFVRIPLRIFNLRDVKQIASFSLAPWSRDIGQLAGRPFDLYRKIYEKLPFYVKQNAAEKE